MYEKLAHGHATAYINGLQDYGRILDWINGPRPAKALEAFERSCHSRKPGRVLKRLKPLLRPQFRHLKILDWTRHNKRISAKDLASTVENQVFCLPDDTRPVYSERAVFLTGVLLWQDYEAIANGMLTGSAISHHAIARLVEREGISPEALEKDIFFILNYCFDFAGRTMGAAINHYAKMSFMLPYKRGALVAVFMDMDPGQMHEEQERRRVLSVRTWLDENKLSNRELERMGGLEELNTVMASDCDAANEHLLRWIKGNARPWEISDSRPGLSA